MRHARTVPSVYVMLGKGGSFGGLSRNGSLLECPACRTDTNRPVVAVRLSRGLQIIAERHRQTTLVRCPPGNHFPRTAWRFGAPSIGAIQPASRLAVRAQFECPGLSQFHHCSSPIVHCFVTDGWGIVPHCFYCFVSHCLAVSFRPHCSDCFPIELECPEPNIAWPTPNSRSHSRLLIARNLITKP